MSPARAFRMAHWNSQVFGSFQHGRSFCGLQVAPSPSNTIEERVRLRRSLRGLGFPFDVFIIATERFEESKNIFGGIAYPAHKYGRVIYEAAEKYLKASLVRHQVEFPKTHNLEQLLDLMAPIAPELAASLEETEVLSPYGVDIRYPGDFPELLPGQEKTVFELASRARQAVMAQLSPFLSGG